MLTLPIILTAQVPDSASVAGKADFLYDLGITIEPARESAPLQIGVANPNLTPIQSQIDSLLSAFSAMQQQIAAIEQENDSLKNKITELSVRLFLSPFTTSTMPLQVYPRDEGERFMQKGQNAYRAKKYLIAIDYFLKAGASDLPNATLGDAYYWIGDCYLQLHDEYLAIEYLKKVMEYPLSEKVDDALFLTGITYRKLENTQMAEIFFTRLIKRYPDGNFAKLANLELKRLKGTD
jgi:tetratricopeptide (TPR) repeat protein